jgi:hypothetical protein
MGMLYMILRIRYDFLVRLANEDPGRHNTEILHDGNISDGYDADFEEIALSLHGKRYINEENRIDPQNTDLNLIETNQNQINSLELSSELYQQSSGVEIELSELDNQVNMKYDHKE